MEFVEPEDEPPFRRPPSPDDRLWRHPSEVGAVGAPPESRAVPTRALWLVAVVSAVGASVLSTGLIIAFGGFRDGSVNPRQSASITGTPLSSNAEPVVEIAERLRPAIVQIRVQRVGGSGSGSGFVFRPDGHVLTNSHVVEGAVSTKVVLADGRELPGKVLGSDADTDTAVIKIDGTGFPAAELGSVTDLKVGQRAVAIASPLALAGGPSVTVGVISALHRTVRTRDGNVLFDMIQTDAPIAPGSSGGALLDSNGRVIGVATAVSVTEAGLEGIGFATPIDVARSVGDELIASGKATHAWMGISGTDVDGATAHNLNLDGGAMVREVLHDSPANRAGLAERDIIVRLDGKEISTMGTLVATLRTRRPGDSVNVDVMRDRKRMTMTVVLVERPPSP